MLDKNPETVNVVFKNFPLAMHKSAGPAAAAAIAANKQDKFWEFHDKLFENMRTLSDAKYQEIAAELELDLEKFNADLKDPAIQALIARDMKNGREAGVRGTPTIFVNGRLLKNRSLAGFQQKIDSELKKLQPEPPKPEKPEILKPESVGVEPEKPETLKTEGSGD